MCDGVTGVAWLHRSLQSTVQMSENPLGRGRTGAPKIPPDPAGSRGVELRPLSRGVSPWDKASDGAVVTQGVPMRLLPGAVPASPLGDSAASSPPGHMDAQARAALLKKNAHVMKSQANLLV